MIKIRSQILDCCTKGLQNDRPTKETINMNHLTKMHSWIKELCHAQTTSLFKMGSWMQKGSQSFSSDIQKIGSCSIVPFWKGSCVQSKGSQWGNGSQLRKMTTGSQSCVAASSSFTEKCQGSGDSSLFRRNFGKHSMWNIHPSLPIGQGWACHCTHWLNKQNKRKWKEKLHHWFPATFKQTWRCPQKKCLMTKRQSLLESHWLKGKICISLPPGPDWGEDYRCQMSYEPNMFAKDNWSCCLECSWLKSCPHEWCQDSDEAMVELT